MVRCEKVNAPTRTRYDAICTGSSLAVESAKTPFVQNDHIFQKIGHPAIEAALYSRKSMFVQTYLNSEIFFSSFQALLIF